MRNKIRHLLCSIAVALLCLSVQTQASNEHLTARFLRDAPERPTAELAYQIAKTGLLRGPAVHRYRLRLAKGQFAALRLKQGQGNLLMTVFAPDGRLIQLVDHNGAGQPEVAMFTANEEGDYAVHVAMFEWTAPPVTYELVWHLQEPATMDKAAIAAQWWRAWYAEDAPGAVALVIEDGQPLLTLARGLADVARRRPMSADVPIDLASVSKQFTAYATALLASQGKIDLDRSIRAYLPELPGVYAPVTVRHLLTHRSGLLEWDRLFALRGRLIADGISAEDVLSMTIRQNALNFAPGERQQYSNTGFVLLALIIERASGQRFDEFVDRAVFKPLAMQHCQWPRTRKAARSIARPSYAKQWPVPVTASIHAMYTVGSSALACSASDLARWLANYDQNKLGDAAVRAMVAPKTAPADGEDYVFGNWYSRRQDLLQIGHQGLAAGFRTSIHRFPERKLAVIVLANDGNDATYEHVKQLEDLFLDLPPTELSVPTDQFEPPPVSETPDVASWRALVGRYRCATLGTRFRIGLRDQQLHLSSNELPETNLRPNLDPDHTDRFYSAEWWLPAIQFQRNAKGQVTSLSVPSESEGTQVCTRR